MYHLTVRVFETCYQVFSIKLKDFDHPRPQAQARAALTVALVQAVDLRRNSDAEGLGRTAYAFLPKNMATAMNARKGHVLKGETSKRNDRNETAETIETTETTETKRPKRNSRNETTETKRPKRNDRNGRKYKLQEKWKILIKI